MSNKLHVSTAFVEDEEPSSTKLNAMDARTAAMGELIAKAIVDLGGDDRVIDDPSRTTELKVTASGTPDMNVHVDIGLACISDTLCQNESSTTKTIVAPTTSNRYTIVQISKDGVISTKDGAESGSPSEPAADTDNLKLCAIYLPQNTTKIENTSGGFGYIIDRREPMANHPSSVTRHVSFYITGSVLVAGGPASDGYYIGTTGGVGWTPGKAITIEKGFIQAQEIPVGADLILTIHNKTDPTSDTITLSDGSACEEDSTIDLDLDAADVLAIQVTQVGSSTAGGDLNVVLQYKLQ